MSRNYKFKNSEGVYFVSFAVVEWLDVFTRNEYKDLFLESLSFCQKNKGMEVFAWCIMTNHVHLIFRVSADFAPEKVLGDLKRFTSRSIIQAIRENPKESRKERLLAVFTEHGSKTSNTTNNMFWRHDNKPIELWSNKVIDEKINYVHYNPVEAGLVAHPHEYLYSSARDYADEKGLLDDVVVIRKWQY
tara:strand:- start:1636 stop:2202 length:567 start_codon:yes stop_codon:yes gene_type:complete